MKLTPKHKTIEAYYRKRMAIEAQGVTHELAVREAFKGLLDAVGALNKWTLVVEERVAGVKKVVRPDGTLKDEYRLAHGYWEAKDSKDDLYAEIAKKFERGYPKSNIIFEDTRRAVLYQNGRHVGEYDLSSPGDVADLLNQFLSFTEPTIEEFHAAVEKFKTDTKRHAESLADLIRDAHRTNKAFEAAFNEFYELCKTALNPNISRDAVDEMLIQHLLTERLMRTVLDNPDFARRNVIAVEVEKVIDALTSKSFSRAEFLGKLDYFYKAIEGAARNWTDFGEKQAFINTVYERFFQGYAVKVADTHGIVYTPQPIVDFMCAAVEEVLRDEFNLSLADEEVCIIDPATGTGNFIINLLHRIHQTAPHRLPEVYQKRLFANEVMLLPYYVASLNIEHAYFELTGQYAPFEGLCFVDTLDLAEGAQMAMSFITQKNSERVERQKIAPITVIIGNPPYNVGQLNENDNNKNRKYEVIDGRVRDTYARDSNATLRMQLYDPYVKFFRWASDRLQGRDGIVCYVSNNSFVDQIAFDGMRKHILQDFSRVYHLDLHGNVRQNPKLSGTTHNVFGIQVGVGITVAVRSSNHDDRRLFYHRVPEFWRKEEKLGYLRENVEAKGRENSLNTVEWSELFPDERFTWHIPENADEFAAYVPLGSKEAKRAKGSETRAVFHTYSNGPKSNADNYVYDFSLDTLVDRSRSVVDDYRSQLGRWIVEGRPNKIDGFLKVDETIHKWVRNTKRTLLRGKAISFDVSKIRLGIYRPFNRRFYYFEDAFNEDIYQFGKFLPTPVTEKENRIICVSGVGSLKPFQTLVVKDIPSHDALEKTQCFPFYVYDEAGGNRKENITDWALGEFRRGYGDAGIGKWDIFYYVYGLLHHPGYRRRYGENLKRELPRIPLVKYPHPPAPSPQSGEGERSPSMLGGEGFGVGMEKRYAPVLGDTYTDRDLWEKLKPLARQMRHDPTLAEERLWKELRGKRLGGYKFRRQHPIDRFIADFYCHEARLIIEVDGPVHDYTPEQDAVRQAYLESLGLRVLRFANDDVLSEMDGVVERIYEEIMRPHPPAQDYPHPSVPSPQSGEGRSENPSMLGEAGIADDAAIFWAFAEAGRQLAELHLNYETVTPYALEYRWASGKPISYRVEKMRLNKDKTELKVNESLTLAGIPAAAFEYRLGNRSALDWVIDQYQVKTDARSGITSDPNLYSEDERYIVELVGRVIAVSVQTVAIVNGLPELGNEPENEFSG